MLHLVSRLTSYLANSNSCRLLELNSGLSLGSIHGQFQHRFDDYQMLKVYISEIAEHVKIH